MVMRIDCILRRSLTYNMVMGTSVGFTKVLTLIGVGYRASMAGNVLTLNLGFSHPVVIPVPKDITVVVRAFSTQPFFLGPLLTGAQSPCP